MDSNQPNKPPHPRRRATDINPPTGSIDALEARMATFEDRMGGVETKLDKNTELTEDIVKLFEAMSSGVKFLGWLGAALKWVAMCAGALISLAALFHKDMPK